MQNFRTFAFASASGLMVLGLACSNAHGQTTPGLLLQDWQSDEQFQASVDGTAYDTTDSGRGKGREVTGREFAEGRARFSRSEKLSPTLGIQDLHLNVSGPKGSFGDLDDASIALATPVAGGSDWFAGGLVALGYAGDRAFGDGQAWYGRASAMYGMKLGPDESLLFVLDYDGNRSYFRDIPLPSFAYTRKLGPEMEYILGVPLSAITYRPTANITLSAEYELPYTIKLEGRYDISRTFGFFGRYVSEEDTFRTSESRGSSRLFFEEQRLEAGVVWKVAPELGCEASLTGGYAFGRKFLTGYNDFSADTLTDLDDAFFVRAGLTFGF